MTGRRRRLGAGLAAVVLVVAAPMLRVVPAGAATWALDATFGNAGVWELGLTGQAGDLEAQPDGKLVVALTDGPAQDAVVLRRLPDGTPDTTFGQGGLARLSFGGNETATALTLTSDGKIVVAGASDCVAAVRRLQANGTPDTTFGTGGQATIALNGCRTANDVAVQPDGKVLVLTEFWLHRLLADGTPDPTFGQAGTISVATSAAARVVALQADGKILVGGGEAFGVRRYLGDGSPDSGFGSGGLASFPAYVDRYVNAIAIDGAGRVTVAGAIYGRVTNACCPYQGSDGGYVFSLARFTAAGQPDTTFGGEGAVQTGFGDIGASFGGIGAVARRLAIGADGTILAGGLDVGDAAFARYLPDGTLDTSFDGDGRLDVNYGPYADGAVAGMTVTSDGRIVALSETRLSRIAEAPALPSTTSSTASSTTSTTTTTAPTSTTAGPPDPPPTLVPSKFGYWMVGADGAVYAFGDARSLGNAPISRHSPAVDLEPTPTGNGYWVVDDLGNVFGFGDAVWRGFLDRSKLAFGEKITSLSATSDGKGYWIFTNKGRALTFGNAPFLGDVSNLALAGPVLDSIVTPSGKGYYMVASDGGIFAFGDAKFYGSMGGHTLNAPVQSLVPDSDGVGYWLVASDGGIFAFQADFKGSMGGTKLNKPVTGMVRAGRGYLMVGEDGGIFDFSGNPASFKGSLGANPPAHPITSVAVFEPH